MILIDVILIQQKDEKQYINKILCNQWHRRFHTLAGVFLLDRFGYGSCVGQDTINLGAKASRDFQDLHNLHGIPPKRFKLSICR